MNDINEMDNNAYNFINYVEDINIMNTMNTTNDISTNDISTNNIVLNVKQSPKDVRDFIYNFSSCEVKEILDYRNELLSVRNQGVQGTCYAQSAACMKEWQERRDYGLNEYLSPQFFYNNRNNWYDDDYTNDEGMYGRNVMKLLKEIGICT